MRVCGQFLDVRDGVARRLARAKARRAYVHGIGPAIDGRLTAFQILGGCEKLKSRYGRHVGSHRARGLDPAILCRADRACQYSCGRRPTIDSRAVWAAGDPRLRRTRCPSAAPGQAGESAAPGPRSSGGARCLLHLAKRFKRNLVVHGGIPQQEPVGAGALGRTHLAADEVRPPEALDAVGVRLQVWPQRDPGALARARRSRIR